MGQLIEACLYGCLRAFARMLSFRAAGKVGTGLASLVYWLGIRKGVTLQNLERAFPGKTKKELRRIARGAYCNYGIVLLELMWSSARSKETVWNKVRWENWEVFQRAFDRGKGVIFFSAHFGSWELGAITAGFMAGLPLGVIVQTQSNLIVDRMVNRDRARFGNFAIPMGVAVRETVRILKQGRIVAMLGDQSAAKESLPVNFFGHPVAAHRGAAAFSIRMGSPIVGVFLYRQPDGVYRAQLEEVDCQDFHGTTEQRIDELTRRLNAVLEERIRQRPDHWLWMHKRWKHTAYYEALQEKVGSPVAPGNA